MGVLGSSLNIFEYLACICLHGSVGNVNTNACMALEGTWLSLSCSLANKLYS